MLRFLGVWAGVTTLFLAGFGILIGGAMGLAHVFHEYGPMWGGAAILGIVSLLAGLSAALDDAEDF